MLGTPCRCWSTNYGSGSSGCRLSRRLSDAPPGLIHVPVKDEHNLQLLGADGVRRLGLHVLLEHNAQLVALLERDDLATDHADAVELDAVRALVAS